MKMPMNKTYGRKVATIAHSDGVLSGFAWTISTSWLTSTLTRSRS